MFLADILHHLNPNLIEFSEKFKIRWYGLAYVAGFVAAYFCMRRLARKGIGELKEREVADFITYAALFGVMLGGRLGYMLLYDHQRFFENPLTFFHVSDGGMSAHGGIMGLFFFTLVYAWKTKKSWPGVGDNLCCVSPLGILFGRLANFVNGELYGNPLPVGHPLAVRFPYELHEFAQDMTPERLNAARALLPPEAISFIKPDPITHAARSLQDATPDEMITIAREVPDYGGKLKDLLTPRHPSQLYEAALEGLALFLILWWIRVRWPKSPHGTVTGFFFIFYAVFRMFCEKYFRVGDGQIMGMSRGYFYSTFLIGIGAAFLINAFMHRKSDAAKPA